MKEKYYIVIVIVVAAILLSSCKDEISLNGVENKQELVVYSFPSTADTTYISVSCSSPIAKGNTSKIKMVDDATVTYIINGVPQNVTNRGDGFYYVVAKQKAGDKITVSVAASGLPEAEGETTIPDTVALGNAEVSKVRLYDRDYEQSYNYFQVSATFTDDANTHDYYIPRIRMNSIMVKTENNDSDYYDIGYSIGTDTINYYPTIHTQSEPLLTSINEIDDDFGFSADMYGDLCIFDDAAINGQSHRLRLNVNPNDYSFNKCLSKEIRLELLHITPELYRFLNAVNSISNSDLAQHGLAQISPTVTNVRGGFGLIAGWNVSRTQYVDVDVNYSLTE